jgi:hypothetical protein
MGEGPPFNSIEYWQEATRDSPAESLTEPKEYPRPDGVVVRRYHEGDTFIYTFIPHDEQHVRRLTDEALQKARRRTTARSSEEGARGAE